MNISGFIFCFETVFFCFVLRQFCNAFLAGLELAMLIRLALSSQNCLLLPPRVGLKGMCYHVALLWTFVSII